VFGLAIGCVAGESRTTRSEPGESFANKSIQLLVAAQAGGAYDLVGRIVAERIVEYIPGKPTIIVQNMPGAGGLQMTNYLYNVSPKDGTTFGLPLNSILLEPTLHHLAREGGQVRFDLAKMNWIGTPIQDPAILLVKRGAGDGKFEGIRSRSLIIGTAGSGSDSSLVPSLCNGLLKTQLKIVRGYRGLPDILIAFERGEVEAFSAGYAGVLAARPHWLKDGTIDVVVQFGSTRLASLQNVPTAVEIADDHRAQEMLRLFAKKFDAAYPFMLPPGVSPSRVAMYRNAFEAMLKDTIFERRFAEAGFSVNPVSGEGIQHLVEGLARVDPGYVSSLQKILSE
jgi:tripartite-type tricarboxylate transporter receptor subunit TctC